MTAEPYWWFSGASVQALRAQLQENSRLELHKVGDQVFLTVVTPGQTTQAAPINDSHVCPPQCP